jgi:thioredoxin-like negative regulator of GroEL
VSAAAEPENAGAAERPLLVFFHSSMSGSTRKVEGFLAQVLQRRRNHEAFQLLRVDVETHPELPARFGVEDTDLPALVVVDRRRVSARVDRPRGCTQIAACLAPWLR